MITGNQNIALLTVANAASQNPNWTEYVNYCIEREKGLRKKALKHLDTFLRLTSNWTYEQRIEFVKFFCSVFQTVEEGDYGAFPTPLSNKLVEPTSKEWCELEPDNQDALRWYGEVYKSEKHLLRVLQLSPVNDEIRKLLLKWWSYEVSFSLHHLPEGYIGEPSKDLELAEKMKEQISLLVDAQEQDYWRNEMNVDLEIIYNYLDWERTGHASFEKWGEENNKTVGYRNLKI